MIRRPAAPGVLGGRNEHPVDLSAEPELHGQTGATRPRRPARQRRHPVAAAVTVAAAISVLVSGTVFGLVASSGDDGAADPVAAVQDFLSAFASGDALGLLRSLPPDERGPLQDALPGIADELQRLGLTSPLSLSDIPGVTIEIRDLKFYLNKVYGEVGFVQVAGGQLVISTNPDRFPLSERTRQLLDRDFHARIDPASGTRTIDLGEQRPTFVAIKDSGGWRTSLFFTIAELVRGGDSGPLPRYNEGPKPVGAETPAKVVEELFRAASNLDPTSAVVLAYPPEARALYDYAGLFLPEARRRAQAIAADEPFRLDVSKVEVDVSGDSGTRLVRVVRFEASARDGDDRRRYFYDLGCLNEERMKPNSQEIGETIQACDGVIGPAVNVDAEGDASRLDKVTAWQRLGRAFPTFVVQERQGRWFVSPTRTVLTTLREILRSLNPEDVDTFSQRVGQLWDLYGPPG